MSDPTVVAKEREVERNRDQLADTVDALHAKLDVKSKVQDKLSATKERATTDSGKPRPVVLAATAVATVGMVALIWWRRR